jgi:uroporphyrinogen decarboxylase
MISSRERVQLALNHQEPDQVPYDLGATGVTGIHRTAYRHLRQYVGLPSDEIRTDDVIQQLAVVNEDVAELLKTDFRSLGRRGYVAHDVGFRDEGDYTTFTDEWGTSWRMPKEGGFYYDMYKYPLAEAETVDDIKDYVWPEPAPSYRIEGLNSQVEAVRDQGKAVVLSGRCAGISEMHARLRGYANYYSDFKLYPKLTEYILDKLTEVKIGYWEHALAEVGEYVEVVGESDDMAGQDRLLLSPKIYQRFLKPRHTQIFSAIKKRAPHVKIFFHTDGAIRPLIGDLIESGIDILNPVQFNAVGMDLMELKREFGQDLVFWGGGVETQWVLGGGAPDEVRDNVKRNIEALASGGGFVFCTVHNTMANVPPENFMAMWETLQEYGVY